MIRPMRRPRTCGIGIDGRRGNSRLRFHRAGKRIVTDQTKRRRLAPKPEGLHANVVQIG